jgi:hypothetical protein
MDVYGSEGKALHYKPASAGEITTQERMDVYGSEGKKVDC